jgi:hypothetical protein
MYNGGQDNLMIDQVIPADQVKGALYPKRVNAIEVFRPSYDRQTTSDFRREFVEAVWPQGVNTGQGAGQADQRYGPETVANRCIDSNNDGGLGENDSVIPRYFYKLSGYDSAEVKSSAGSRNELRYTLFWTGWTVPENPCDPQTGLAGVGESGNAQDNPRQLGYSDPPDTTIVTWDSWFREYNGDGTLPMSSKRDIVLFLGGSARMVDSNALAQQAYAFTP